MTVDITSVLYSRILKLFKDRIGSDRKIQAYQKKIEDKTAKGSDISLYAARLGEIAGLVLTDVLDPENLPNGQLYYNIGSRTMTPLLLEIYEMVCLASEAQMKIEDEREGIKITPIRAPFPEHRVNDLIFKLGDYLEDKNE